MTNPSVSKLVHKLISDRAQVLYLVDLMSTQFHVEPMDLLMDPEDSERFTNYARQEIELELFGTSAPISPIETKE
jgi:hypothetical protein